MAEIIPNEGLDLLLGYCPRVTTAVPTTLYLILCTGATQSTVPAGTAVLSTFTGVAEAAYTGYLRMAILNSSWGAQAAGSGNAAGGRQTSAAQVAFPACTTTPYVTAITFFGLTNLSSHGTEIGIYYANFDDLLSVATMAVGDVIKVTPTFGLLP